MERRWGQAGRAVVLAAALLAGLAAPAAPAPAKALQPVQVALDGLPGAVGLAIQEAEERLLSSEAQRRLAVMHAYVQGFGSLPAGSAALADPEVRAAYTWTEEAVESALGLPAQFDALEEAGALCRAYGNEGTREQVERALTLGPSAEATLAVLRSEMRALAARVPAGVDRAPFDRAVGLLDGYMQERAPVVHACLSTLSLPDRSAELPALFAVVLPPESFRTGHVRVVGTVSGAAQVAASSSSLSLTGQATAVNGTFRIPLTIPRSAALGNHTVTVTAGSLRASANLSITKAPVHFDLRAPSRVPANTTFTALALASSPAGSTLVARIPVQFSWAGANASVPLQNGSARRGFEAGPPREAALVATFAGDDVLAAARDTVSIEVYRPGTATSTSNGGPLSLTWVWWLLVLVGGAAIALLLFMMPVILHRVRGARGQALRGNPSPPRWPGAATFVAAVAALFDLLRRRRLAPPGTTFREWLLAHGGPSVIADRFDAVRYGDQAEDEQLRKTGLSWAEKAWARWRDREA